MKQEKKNKQNRETQKWPAAKKKHNHKAAQGGRQRSIKHKEARQKVPSKSRGRPHQDKDFYIRALAAKANELARLKAALPPHWRMQVNGIKERKHAQPKLCIFWQQGRCKRGAHCKFVHEKNQDPDHHGRGESPEDGLASIWQ